MANTPLTYSLSSIAQQSLQELINDAVVLPTSITFDQHQISLDVADNNITSDLELILLGNWTVNEFVSFINHSQLKLLALTCKNQRLTQTSLRFAVQSDTEEEHRRLLAEFALTIGKEAALIKNAPALEKPGLLVMDMDSTTIEIECIDEIAKLANVGEQVAAVTELAMQGQLDFAQSLTQRVATLKDAPASILTQVGSALPLMPGLEVLITALKQYGWKLAIASGGFTYFADQLKTQLGFDEAVANVLAIKDGKLTGEVEGRIVDAQVKADTLVSLKNKYHIADNQTVAMGDGANDLVMMAAAHLGVAYKAKPLVLKKADSSINFSGLELLVHWLK